MTKKLCFLEVPVSIHELRKTYDDSVDFVTEVGIYPNVTAIAFDGMLSKAIRGKTALKSIKPRVDRLLELYKRRLFRFWDEHTDALADAVASVDLTKGGPGSGCQGPNCGRPKGSGGPIAEKNQLLSSVSSHITNSYSAPTWASGQCANFSFGLSSYLSSKGIDNEIQMDPGGNHVWVRAGNKVLDPDVRGVSYRAEGKPITIDRDKYLNDPQGFREKYNILLTPRRIDEVRRDFNGHDAGRAEKFEKAEEGDDTKKKRAVIAAALAGLGASLAGNALDYYKRAYLLGKERGVSISGKEFRAAITEEAGNRLRGLTAENDEYLKNFMKDLEEKYVDAAQKEYASVEAAKEEARRIAQAHEARLAMYAFAALAALALGMTDGIKEAQPAPKKPEEPTEGAPAGDEPIVVEAEVITGIVWVTSHDDAVCAGCADNDGKFFTFDEFEAEYQQNECLVRCRCAETSVPTAMPPSHFGKSMKLSKLQKGGPGSGCQGPNCGRPKGSGNNLPDKTQLRTIAAAKKAGLYSASGKDIERSWLLPETGVIPVYEDGTHEGVLNDYSYTSADAFESGWARKGDANSYHFVSDNKTAQSSVERDMRQNRGTLNYRSDEVYIDVYSGKDLHSYQIPIDALAQNNYSLDGLLKDEYLIKFEKGGPGSGCQGPNCGRPKGGGSTLAYHGTTADFDVFETEPKNKKSFSGLGETSIGAFFSEDKDTAATYPLSLPEGAERRVRDVTLDIKNPKKYRSLDDLRNDLMGFIEQRGLSLDTRERLGNAQKFKEHLESQGYDGLTFLEGKANATTTDKKRVWSAFSPVQIKINKFEKGGPGSGCQGPNCGRPKGVVASAEFKLRAKNPGAWEFNDVDPVKTTDLDGRVVEKFSITSSGEFVPVGSGQFHSHTLPITEFDSSTRVVQDLKRKVAVFRFSGSDAEVKRALSGDVSVWNTVRARQAELAERLYSKHPGMQVILASGGPDATDLHGMDDIPDNPARFADKKYVYRT